MKLNVSYPLAPCRPSVNTAVVRDHFGVSLTPDPVVVANEFEVPIVDRVAGDGNMSPDGACEPGQIALFVGPSGSGKSSLLHAAVANLTNVVDAATWPLGERALVDELPWRVDDSLRLLALCGLGEAQILLRTPHELSEGQRYRFRLAQAVAQRPAWVLADEFTATLDRTLARIVAFGVRRIADTYGTNFLLATTHEDVLADLAADVLVRCELGEAPRVETIGASVDAGSSGIEGEVPLRDGEVLSAKRGRRKKKDSSVSRTSSPLRPARSATGRTLLGGIIGDTGWGWCGS